MPKAQDSYSLIHRRNTSSTRPVTKECFQLIFVTNFLDRCGKYAQTSNIYMERVLVAAKGACEWHR
jgi:hypothetical protein